MDGVIQSNDMPTTYIHNMDCQWNISSNARVELVFFRLDIESSYDYVTVYDGGSLSSPMIGTFSGNSRPAPITSSSAKLYVRFTSDHSITYGGFRAHYRGEIYVKTTLTTSIFHVVCFTFRACTKMFYLLT